MRNLINVYHWRVRKVIAESGMTSVEIARKMGCDRKVLGNTRVCMMSSGNLAKFCAITHVSADYILGLSDVMEIQDISHQEAS